MNRDQFHARMAHLDEDGLRKALWTLYWRGSAEMRERIEAQLGPDGPGPPRRRPPPPPPDGARVLDEVRDFVALARAGAYWAGDRRVSPRERSRWRFTFRRLASDARDGLAGEQGDAAGTALALMIDLSCEVHGVHRFRSEDPVQAAGFVVSDAAAALWSAHRDRHGFAAFVDHAVPQLLRWESRHGWTRFGDGTVARQEQPLATVMAGMLSAPDHWTRAASRYLQALDDLATGSATRARRRVGSSQAQRTGDLAAWHAQLLDHLAGAPEGDGLLDRLVEHPALGGPEQIFLQAQLAHRRGDDTTATQRVRACLDRLPGHPGFRELGDRLGVTLPD